MGFGSGLSGQVGFGAESTYNTIATVDHFYDATDALLALTQNRYRGAGVRAGGQMRGIARNIPTTRTVGGAFKADVTSKKFGLLLRHITGSSTSAPTNISGAAYKQVHQLGNGAGLSLTGQIGKPQVDGTVKPFTYSGLKALDWDLTAAVDGVLNLAINFDGADETTATGLTAASYPTPIELFQFTSCVIKLGGTASTASGVVSIAGGTQMTQLVRGLSVKGTTALANGRFGPNPTKREQIQNGFTDCVLTLDPEFGSQAELYDVWRADTVVPVQITFTGSQIGVTGSYNSLDVVIPAAKIQQDPVTLNGMDLVTQAPVLEVGDDRVNNPLQITYISVDTTI